MDKKSELKFKLKVKREKNNNHKIVLWIQKKTELENELESLFNFFEKNIRIMDSGIIFKSYKITSENPAIMYITNNLNPESGKTFGFL